MALAIGKISARGRKCYKVDLVCVLRSRDKCLHRLVCVVNNDIVTCHVEKLLLFVYVKAVVELAVYTEDESRTDCHSLHAHVGLHHI